GRACRSPAFGPGRGRSRRERRHTFLTVPPIAMPVRPVAGLSSHKSIHFREEQHETQVSVKRHEVRGRKTLEVEKPEAVRVDVISPATDCGTPSLSCPPEGP